MDDEEFYQKTLESGGASRSVPAGNVPDRGYMVGGVPRPGDNLPYPELKRPVEGFDVDHIRHHAREIRDAFGDSTRVHQGSWIKDNEVVLDASERMASYRDAMSATRSRGQKAFYDVAKDKDVNASNPLSRLMAKVKK